MSGATVKRNRMGTLTQPIQMLPRKEKDEEWAGWCMDWFEMQGLKQVRRNARRLLKNYKLANGIIDKTDYIPNTDAETTELIEVLTQEDESALELKFYPIIPNVINVLVGEFAKRNDKITYRGSDEFSHNEMMEAKRGMLEERLLADAEAKVRARLEQMGMELDSEEAQAELSPQKLKELPEIERFFKKDYRSVYEEWAHHQHNADEERFKLRELEVTGFRDMLVADREFWHFKMNEDDYELELWNPVLSFYHKSPDSRYLSQGNYVGKLDLMSVSDVIDKFGWKMTQKQLESLQEIHPVKSAGYAIHGEQNFYDPSRSYEWNRSGPSLAMRQWMSVSDDFLAGGDDILSMILGQSEDLFDQGDSTMLRVTTAYWKSQQKLGHLSWVDNETGMVMDAIVDESFKITSKPEYDMSLSKEKSRDNLLYGQHVEWIWINQVWGGEKIGLNRAGFHVDQHDNEDFQPIYLDVKPIRFQFKGDYSLYGCKLPVEGAVFSDRNSKSVSVVDAMKPFQIGYNMVNNQIADILVDELGTIIMLDQNILPKHSMGEDWGRDNFGKAFVAMKDFQMLPVDSSIANTESALSFQHYQVLNMEQTNRLLSRVQLSNHFKQQAFESIGISQQRLGAVNAQETATGVEQAINMSYSQTEPYFTQHSEYLMPRVHQMRTDLAQYYHSTKPSVRLSYMTSMDEKVNFEINGTELLGRDINVFCSTKVNTRQVTEQIRQLALTNNTAGASIYDLANLIKADSLSEIDVALKAVEQKVERQRQEEMAHEEEMQKQQIAAAAAAKQKEDDLVRFELEGQWQNNLDVAEVKGAGFQTPDNNDDYLATVKHLDDKRLKEQNLELSRTKELNKQVLDDRKLQQKDRELSSREKIADKALQVARENKNKYDKPKPKAKK
jgi:hypothetical protein